MGDDIEKLEARLCHCGQVMIPPRGKCISCSGSDIGKIIEISNKGKLLSFTVLNIPPEGFNSPLILGLVEIDLDENLYVEKTDRELKTSLKLICQGLSGDVLEDELEIGISVEVEKKVDLYFFKIIR
jgi:uncharacterized OB-fold protein